MSTSSSSKRSGRWRNALTNLALLTFTLLLCVGVAEITLRLMGYGNLEIYEPHPVLYWRLQPNQDCYTKINHQPVHVNSHGTRGREFAAVKPADTIRIISLGDSRTFGWGLTEEETYSGILERLLQEQVGAGKKIEVINCGVNGWSYSQMNVFFREFAVAWQPDIVVVGDANLWTQFSEQGDPAFVKKFLSRVRLKNFLRRFALYHFVVEVTLKEFYEKQRTRFVPVDPAQDTLFKEQQKTDPDALFRTAIENICTTARAHGVQPVLLYLPWQDALLSSSGPSMEVLRMKQAVSKRLMVPLVDPTADLRPQAKEIFLDGDIVHYNAAGNRIITPRLFEAITPLLKHE